LRSHPKFKLIVPLVPRLIRPHPLTNQRVAALARGPLIYCLEDVDNQWVDDHFKSVVLAPFVTSAAKDNNGTDLSKVCKEAWKEDLPLSEGYVSITIQKGGMLLARKALESRQLDFEKSIEALIDQETDAVDLTFVPYWARANRGGKHMMRVGVRTLD